MRKWQEFHRVNWFKRLNRWLQAALSLAFVLGLNYLAIRHYTRWDLTRQQLFSLSPETLAYMRQLDAPVKIILAFSPNSPHEKDQILYRYLRNLLKEYDYAGGENITLEFVDVYKELKRSEELARQHKITRPNLALVISGDRRKIVSPEEIMEFEDHVTPVSFKGEKAFTSAILEVSQNAKPKIYFTIGHGERRLGDVSPMSGLSQLALELRMRNFSLETIDLTRSGGVPEGTDLLLAAGPKGPFAEQEVESLRAYLADRDGRVIVLLEPGHAHGLETLLYEWGILSDDMAVLETGDDYKEASGSVLIRQFAPHPITRSLIQNATPVVSGTCRPVRQAPAGPADPRLSVTQIMGSSGESWAERRYNNPGEQPRYDPGVDLPGPVSIAAAAERRSSSRLGIRVTGGRLLVIGSAGLFSNRRISSHGNYRLFFNALNWMLDRDHLLAIPPRPVEDFQMALSRQELLHLVFLFLVLPGAAGSFGLCIFWLRKR